MSQRLLFASGIYTTVREILQGRPRGVAAYWCHMGTTGLAGILCIAMLSCSDNDNAL